MITNEVPITLGNIGDGELERQFNQELQKVYKNIVDPETTDDAREINIKIAIKPSKDNRAILQFGFGVKRKDASYRPFYTGAILENDHGKFVAKELQTQEQKPIPFTVTKTGKEGGNN